ncbi:HNH endonuclease [Azotobacter chroococcum]|uniref:HNH endonuclease n=1 Tax=Azotobacter chroococcum TaxID=353 RepID=UPI00103C7E82|nr:HNH endonuclease [Azotobacter chroococcum]TBV95944.1 HNH endonuclease [Azotobacter chroococcum]
MLESSRLRELFDYNAETGVFIRKVRTTNNVKVGQVAGCIRPDGYLGIYVDNQSYQAHRLAWLYVHGRWPDGQIDHINGIRTDNRIANLRDVSHVENGRNQRLARNNTSGVNGIHWFKRRNKWRVEITVDRKKRHIGYFENLEDAVAARKAAEQSFGFHENHGRAIDAAMGKGGRADD